MVEDLAVVPNAAGDDVLVQLTGVFDRVKVFGHVRVRSTR